MLEQFYKNPDLDMAANLNEFYQPPSEFIHGEDHLVAHLGSDDTNDGYEVLVYECRMPAVFFKVIAKPTPNSVGEVQPGFEIGFGSDCGYIAGKIAILINEGMMTARKFSG